MTGKLQICKASAGSGKTHKLTGEYLQMLFNGGSDAYKHILAVTFTNKATAEMKQRILKELKHLADKPQDSPYYSDILSCVKSHSPQEVQTIAQNHLIAILNDYSYFNISTIDKFFQRVLRAFAMEMGHFASYEVLLDSDAVMQFVVDEMMASIDSDAKLFDWLLDMSYESIKNGENWDTVPKLLKLGKELFSEKYRLAVNAAGGQVLKRSDINNAEQKMRKIEEDRKRILVKAGKDALAVMGRYGLQSDDFSGKTKSHAKQFDRLAEGEIRHPTNTFLKAVDKGVEKWFIKKSPKEAAIREAYADGLEDVAKIVADVKLYDEYFTAVEIRRNLTAMGVFSDLEDGIRDYCRKYNVVLISQTVNFLTQIIDGSDTPFIYEKIGGRLSDYLLDEFQDTSTMQWSSFKPLVKESVDGGNSALIVGDVKQSIYRWRSSDWSLLDGKVEHDVAFAHKTDVENLEYNWRSSKEVVEFNNGFFSELGELLSDKNPAAAQSVADIYKDAAQKIPAKNNVNAGHVYVRFFEEKSDGKNSNGSEDNDKVYSSDEYFTELVGQIERLLSSGYRQKDIALLVRTNNEAAVLAEFLISKGYSIITEEALKLQNSSLINKIVNTIKLHDDPDSKSLFETLDDVLEGFDRSLPLYDLCEEMIRLSADNSDGETAYTVAFLDAVTQFISLYGSDITAFLGWWETEGSQKPVVMPDGQDALHVMTIHKSKGLEFPAVIIPQMSFKFDVGGKGQTNYFWCRTDDPVFNSLPYYPLELRKDLEKTVFGKDYKQEQVDTIIDVCNVTYVALTRAEKELIIFSKYKVNAKREISISDMPRVLYNYLKDKMVDGIFESGQPTSYTPKQVSVSAAEAELHVSELPSLEIGERLSLSLSGGDFFSSGDETMRRKGIVLHDIMADVETAGDLSSAVMSAVETGKLSADAVDEVRSALESMIGAAKEYHWFDGTYELLLETPIITPEGDTYRPDRIMIDSSENKAIVVDYKFGQKHESSHKSQVDNYAKLLRNMGMEEVEAYLWYGGGNIVKI